MQIQVKLYASLRRFCPHGAPGVPFLIELAESASLQDLINSLGLPAGEAKLIFVNGTIQEPDLKLKPGDEVGIFPPIGGGAPDSAGSSASGGSPDTAGSINIDTWLYGGLAKYGGPASQGSFAHLEVNLPTGSTIADLLAYLHMPGEARGITFINGELSAMPGMQPDLDHVLHDGDRAAFFHPLSMWPFQYRHGIPMAEELSQALQSEQDGGVRHSYDTGSDA